MSKKELVKALMKRMEEIGYFLTFTKAKTFIKEYEKLAKPEPQKPVVPQFVADWIEKSKTVAAGTLSGAYINAPERVRLWWKGDNVVNVQIFARAWLDGYTVEEEKQYELILCNGQSLKTVYRQGEDRLDFEKVYGDLERFTRKQLEEAGFGWVFDCPGIEIKEVK